MSSLTISRNKHWRYISAFHGPWLQLPHEVLETLAHSNYLAPRPRQTDPAVLFDLLKVRRLVDEAADLAVRAQNGTASSALTAENGLPGAALGLNTRGGAGGNAKLSPERKYRMREQATLKLSQAYRLDEIAASVATMQSASALDTVASQVLQRAPQNADAQYVNFFHEKIPSRMMAEYTPLDPLNHIIALESSHAAPYRTRALTKIFKEDFAGAANDLTEALLICRNEQAKHTAGKNQLITQRQAREDAERRKTWTKDWISENRVLEEDQPKGLEMQLLFQRGNQYLTIASSHLKKSLEAFKTARRLQHEREAKADLANGDAENQNVTDSTSSEEHEAYKRGLESRELVRKFAKRALRDYTAFFSQLDYGIASDPRVSDVFDRGRVLGEEDELPNSPSTSTSQSLVKRARQSSTSLDDDIRHLDVDEPGIKMYDLGTMLSSKPPDDIPPFPAQQSTGTVGNAQNGHNDSMPSVHSHEMLTYHPLLPETLHSFLLTHCLLQTAPTTFNRIANNAARLSRLADGYPFFLSARSPARADWAEILRQTNNWIGLAGAWDHLCRLDMPGDSNNSSKSHGKGGSDLVKKATGLGRRRPADETPEQKRDRIHKEAVMEALGDERVVDDESFQKAVKAREERALREQDPSDVNGFVNGTKANGAITNGLNSDQSNKASDKPAQSSGDLHSHGHEKQGSSAPVAKDEEYLIGTERAACIARWIKEAPTNPSPVEGMAKPKRKKKAGAAKQAPVSQQSSDLSAMTEASMPD